MLKLVFYTKDKILKVRRALPEDSFDSSCVWRERLQLAISENGDFMMTWTSLLPDLEPEFAVALVELVGARYPLSVHYEELKSICPKILFQNPTGEWVFYGGTFNPWHHGHQACINLLPDDKYCLILPDKNPHKPLREISTVSTVLEISSKARFKKRQFLVPTFLLRKESNPTVEWVKKFKDDFPSERLSLLLGFDSFAQLKSWTRSQELLPLLDTIYVVSRLEDDEDRRLALDEAHAFGPRLNVVFLGKHEYEAVSSTEIRNRRT